MDDAKKEIVEFLNEHCKGGDMGAMALTQFHFVLDEDGEPVPFVEKHGRVGLADIMEKLSVSWPETVVNDDEKIIAAGRELSAVSLGQGGQLVVSIAPMLTIAEIEAEYRSFLKSFELITTGLDYKLVASGFNPAAAVGELVAVPYEPYQHVQEHLGDAACELLLGTARCRVAFEYADERDAVLKLRVATLLGPVFAFIAENTPVYDKAGNDNLVLGMGISRKAAAGIAGAVPGLFDDDFGFGKYAQWLLENDLADEHGTPIRELVMDVDLSNRIELAQADALPVESMLGYLALLRGIFYSPTTLELLEIMLKLDRPNAYNDATVDEAVAAIAKDGGNAKLYGNTVDGWVDLLFRMAGQALGTEGEYLEEFQEFKGF